MTAAASVNKTTFKKRVSAARIGDPAAQYEVATMLANGIGTQRNVDEAMVWFKAAAEKGHSTAQYLLAIAHGNGVGTEKDGFQALQWFMKAAEQGNDKAMLKLARTIAENHLAIAFAAFMKAARLGVPDAQFEVAERLARGLGTPRREDAARDWYEKAARQGVARAQYALAEMLSRNAEQQTEDEDAVRWYRAAAAQGHPGAQLALSRLDVIGKGREDHAGRRRSGAQERRQAGQRWERFAESGRPEDRYHVGFIHEAGIDVEQDLPAARRWYRLAADEQHRDSQVALARLCEAGDSDADQQQAGYWWQRAAELGSAEAQFMLGRRQAADPQSGGDPLKSLAWTMRAADQGHPHALMAVFELLSGGAHQAAEACLRRAAELGQAEAQFVMGRRLASGAAADKSHLLARDWLERAAVQGNADAQCELGAWYAQGHGRTPDFVGATELDDWVAAGHGAAPDFVLARDWYEKAAEQGHLKAQWLLGGLHATGAAGVPRDARLAMLWCKRSAEAGFAPAQATLGILFAQARKMDRAVTWWTRAAAQGDAEAQFNLANAYRAGNGVAADLRTAFLLLNKAAAAGIAAAQTRVGLAYVNGEGAAIDPVEATKWFLIAQAGGDSAAAANARHARSLLNPAQLAEAEWRATEWIKDAGGRRQTTAVADAPGVLAGH